MRIIIVVLVFAAALAIYFVGIKMRRMKEESAADDAAVKSAPNWVMWILIAAWSVMCAIIGGLLAPCTEKPSKEVTLSVVDKAADKNSVTTYFRLSDGYTGKISSSICASAP